MERYYVSPAALTGWALMRYVLVKTLLLDLRGLGALTFGQLVVAYALWAFIGGCLWAAWGYYMRQLPRIRAYRAQQRALQKARQEQEMEEGPQIDPVLLAQARDMRAAATYREAAANWSEVHASQPVSRGLGESVTVHVIRRGEAKGDPARGKTAGERTRRSGQVSRSSSYPPKATQGKTPASAVRARAKRGSAGAADQGEKAQGEAPRSKAQIQAARQREKQAQQLQAYEERQQQIQRQAEQRKQQQAEAERKERQAPRSVVVATGSSMLISSQEKAPVSVGQEKGETKLNLAQIHAAAEKEKITLDWNKGRKNAHERALAKLQERADERKELALLRRAGEGGSSEAERKALEARMRRLREESDARIARENADKERIAKEVREDWERIHAERIREDEARRNRN